MRVTTQYRIPLPVPFVDVHLDRDNRIFLDPSAIRNAPKRDVLANRARGQLLTFFQEVLRCLFGNAKERAKGEALLHRLHEPNETRLGMSHGRPQGHAFGEELGSRLWNELRVNPAARHDVIRRLEHVPIFIRQVGPDLISDLTTRVIFDVLADFTNQMVLRYPALGRTTNTTLAPIWNPKRSVWVDRAVTLPYASGRTFLLVPKRWVWRAPLLMNPYSFYARESLRTIQEELTPRTLRHGSGQHPPTKKFLRERYPDVKETNTTKAVEYRHVGDTDLVERYERFVDSRFEPLTDEEIEERTR